MRKQFSCLFMASFLSILFIFVIVSTSFSQQNVNDFASLNNALSGSSSSSSSVINITTPTIDSTAAYNRCTNYINTKTIIGFPEGSILNGKGFAGISLPALGQFELHLSSITIYNFKKVSNPGSIDNGAGLYSFISSASVHFDGNVNIISNTISGGGSSFQTYGGDGAGVCISMSKLYASSVTLNFIANKSSDASGAALYFNGSEVIFFNDKILFQDNEAGDEGAALWAWDNARLEFMNSSVTFLRNRADMIAKHSSTTNPSPLGIGGAVSIKH